MTDTTNDKKVMVLSCSGGMDSTGLLMHSLAKGYDVHVISYYYGQKHSVELERLEANIEYLKSNGFDIVYNKVDISSIMSLYHSALTSTSIDVPEGHYEDENMKLTVVPNRNAIFASMVYGYALSVAKKYNTKVSIGLGIHSGDHAIYPDCTPQWLDKIYAAFKAGNWDGELVSTYVPYIQEDKFFILKDTIESCKITDTDFDTVLANTNTCYAPDSEGKSCGKCGSCTERLEAFEVLNRLDPVPYK